MKVGRRYRDRDGERRNRRWCRPPSPTSARSSPRALIENMPLSGRQFQDLSLLVPGTRPSNYYDPTKTEVGGISYGGRRAAP